jgi:hypothetical protein
MSVCPSVGSSFPMEQLGFHWTIFNEIKYLSIFRKSAEEVTVLLKLDNKNGYFTWRPVYVFGHISLNSSLNEKRLDKVVEKIEANIFGSITVFRKSCHL